MKTSHSCWQISTQGLLSRRSATLALVMVLLITSMEALSASCTASVSGNWSNTATWGGSSVPAAADNITIRQGVQVNMDVNGFCSVITSMEDGSSITGPNSLTLNSNSSITVVPEATATISCVIAGASGSLSIEGGILILTGTNIFTGSTLLKTGILNIRNAQATGTTAGGVVVTSGARLELQGGISVGAEALSLAGEGGGQSYGCLYNISGANTWNGPITIDGYSTRIHSGPSGPLVLTNSIDLNGYILIIQGPSLDENLISGTIKSTGGGGVLSKVGQGSWTISGTNTFSGGTELYNGRLVINNPQALGTESGTFTIGGVGNDIVINNTSGAGITTLNYPMVWNDNFRFIGSNALNLGTGPVMLQEDRTVTVSGNTLTVGGVISGTGMGIVKAGAGTLVLAGASTYSGSTLVSGGTLVAGANSPNGSAGAFGNAGTAIILGDAATTANNSSPVLLTGGNIVGRDITVANQFTNGTYTIGGNTSGTSVFSGNIILNQPLTITQQGSGTCQFSGSINTGNHKITKTGTGTLQRTMNALSLGGAFEVTSGIYDANGMATAISGLTTLSGGEYMARTGTQTFNGGLTVSGGTFTGATGNVTTSGLTLSSGTLTAPSGTFSVSGNWLKTGGTFIPGSNTVTFTGNSAQLLNSGGSAFQNLSITGSGGVTSQADLAVNGILNLQTGNPTDSKGCLDMASFVLSMGATAGTTGPGDVSGTVSRSFFTATTPYTFGNQYTTLTFSAGGILPSTVSINISLGTAPSWKTHAVRRSYDIMRSGGSGNSLEISLHYLDSELNGNAENELLLWDYHAISTPLYLESLSRSDKSTNNNWVSTTGFITEKIPTAFEERFFTLAAEVYAPFEGSKGWRMISAPTATTCEDLLNGFISQGMTHSWFPLKQPNFLWFDETDTLTTNMSWRTETDITNPVKRGRGFYFYVLDSASAQYNSLPRRMTSGGNAWFTTGTFSFSGENQPVTYTKRTGIQHSTGPDDNTFYDISLADQGWNLLGNPSQATLNWDAASGWTKTHLDNSIYIWDPADKEFKVWNGIAGTMGNGLIAPFQGFWVKANAASPGLSFTNAVLTSGGTFYGGGAGKKVQGNGNEAEIVELSLEAAGMKSHALISFMENAVIGPDIMDAYRLEPLSDSWLELFTLSSPASSMPLIINNLPAGGQDYLAIPLYTGGKQSGHELDGKFTLKWKLPPDWPDDWAISLHDHLHQNAVSMNKNQEYEFQQNTLKAAGSGNDSVTLIPVLNDMPVSPVARGSKLKSSSEPSPFTIIIQKGSSVADPEYIAPQPHLLPNFPNPFSTCTTFRFSLPVATRVSLSIYDMCGRLIAVVSDKFFEAGIQRIEWNNRSVSPGLYSAHMTTGQTSESVKLLITSVE